MIPFKHILVATDFSESSQRAMDLATSLALAAGAGLTLQHTVEIPSYSYLGFEYSTVDLLSPLEEAAQKSLDAAVRALSEKGVTARGVLRSGVAWEHILNVAKLSKADVIVMGTHGRKGVAHALIGSVAEKIVRMSPIPVLTVRGEANA